LAKLQEIKHNNQKSSSHVRDDILYGHI
jgi:hypothetical protein